MAGERTVTMPCCGATTTTKAARNVRIRCACGEVVRAPATTVTPAAPVAEDVAPAPAPAAVKKATATKVRQNARPRGRKDATTAPKKAAAKKAPPTPVGDPDPPKNQDVAKEAGRRGGLGLGYYGRVRRAG